MERAIAGAGIHQARRNQTRAEQQRSEQEKRMTAKPSTGGLHDTSML